MANLSTFEMSPFVPTPPEPSRQTSTPRGRRPWLMARLDSLLSESLRNATPTDLVRHRLMVGAACILLLINSLFLLWSIAQSDLPLGVMAIVAGLGYLVTLLLAHRTTTSTPPAMLLLVTMSLGLVGSSFMDKNPVGGAHAINMMLPALAVYLVGPRKGLSITLLLFAALGLAHPFYRADIGIDPGTITLDFIWFIHIFAGIAFVGAWGLGALHSTAREAAQTSLERTLKELRESESKLNSVIESTDDLVLSLDREGRLITVNSGAKRVYLERAGIVLEPGQLLFHHDKPEERKAWEARLAQVLQGQRLRLEQMYEEGGPRLVLDVSMHPITGEDGQVVGVTLFSRDVTARREAEARLGEMHRTLVDVSRQAGMAEVATGVLHNVGNTLNSVNISTNLVTDRLRQSRVSGLARAAQLLREHTTDMASFLTADPQGQKLPAYLIAVSDQLQEERDALLQEMRSLGESVDHIKSIVSMQQKHARAAGAVEQVVVPQLIDEALRLHAVSFERLGIRIEREYAKVPPVYVDRHKLLQILINLLSNAKQALVDSPQQDKRLGIHVRRAPEEGFLLIEVVDNGVGIAPENLARMFTQGFTTKKTGHGFGLHISALAAAELEGRLTCSSPGPEQGATFTLELPIGVGEQ
ncbi:PAS domain S-box protein [Archangium minus]|uniref:histidine kinase n=2 Tax=Archangium minus TaxID=83450 RepID=A0ABY9X058_9BACT|nr:PAS domain S-box protein [Archangium minus]